MLPAFDPPVSEKQRRAMWAAAKGRSTLGIPESVGKEYVRAEDADISAAGVMIVDPSNNALFLRRGEDSDHAGEWCFPGGEVEDGENALDAMARETHEETGYVPNNNLHLLDRSTSPEGVDFTTFKHYVPRQFKPRLNDEHTEYVWAPLHQPPEPLHPGVERYLQAGHMAANDCVAFDRDSVREIDPKTGVLHVTRTRISKATVNPYKGREVPKWKELGLDPDRIYQMLRDPEELSKAAESFNNLPVLSDHALVTIMDHHPELIVGSLGTDAEFDYPYLYNSMSVWTEEAIEGIESDDQREISASYFYRADMTPGVFEGVRYDGVMRDIKGNHTALVKKGRAGSDVLVGDSMENLMKGRIKLSRAALLAHGALTAALAPLLASDAAIDLKPILADVNSKNFGAKRKVVLARLKKACEGKLATDASLDDVTGLLDHLNGKKEMKEADDDNLEPNGGNPPQTEPGGEVEEDDEEDAVDAGGTNEKLLEFLREKLSPEDMEAAEALCQPAAEDEPPPFEGRPEPGKGTKEAYDKKHGAGAYDRKVAKDKKVAKDRRVAKDKDEKEPKDTVSKAAMDRAIEQAKKDTIKTQRQIADALKEVHPWVGELAMDSATCAEDVYSTALETLGVDTSDLHPTAYRPVLLAQQKPGENTKPSRSSSVAFDSKDSKSFNERFPGASRIGIA